MFLANARFLHCGETLVYLAERSGNESAPLEHGGPKFEPCVARPEGSKFRSGVASNRSFKRPSVAGARPKFRTLRPQARRFEISVGRGEQPNNLKNPYSVKTISKKADHVERNGKRNFRRRTLCPRIAILYVGALVNYNLWLLLEISSG